MSYYGGYSPYVSVAEKRARADRQIEKLRKKHKDLEPVLIEGRTIAVSWWGKAWNTNLESYADYANRIGRGKSYVRNHAVLDLKIRAGLVEALVQGSGSRPYRVEVEIDKLESGRWDKIVELCNHRIDSLEQLIAGKFPRELEEVFQEREYGLFPSPKEIRFSCSCPDYAYMCKHVAAVLYGIGARLDQDPMLFFTLRGADMQDLVKRSLESRMESMLKNAGRKTKRVMAEDEMHDLFGI